MPRRGGRGVYGIVHKKNNFRRIYDEIERKENYYGGGYIKMTFTPCEMILLPFGKDVIATSGHDPFGTDDEDFDIFGNYTGDSRQGGEM